MKTENDIVEIRCPRCQSFMRFSNYPEGDLGFLYECRDCNIQATITFNDSDGDIIGKSKLR